VMWLSVSWRLGRTLPRRGILRDHGEFSLVAPSFAACGWHFGILCSGLWG